MRERTGRRARLAVACLLVVVAAGAAALVVSALGSPGDPSGPTGAGLHVSGNRLLDAQGRRVQFHGVNRSGTEYACIQGWGIFDGPSNAASVRAIASWHVNAVRIPLNEDCWLGINGVKPRFAGANYRRAIIDYVHLLHRYGMYAELSLMWGAPGAYRATYQSGAPDADHSPTMWASMASTFKHDPNVVLAPWGETITGWTCFMRTGCSDQATYGPRNQGYQTAPMQEAVSVMRKAGYRGPIAVPCIAYANACAGYNGSSWLRSRPHDPAHQLIAETHVYGKNTCDTTRCFQSTLAPLARQVPLVFGETGESYDASDCGTSRIAEFLRWADAHRVGYEAWTWDTTRTCLALIDSYRGQPHGAYGALIKAHYASRPAVLLPPQPGRG